ncbi:MAG: hypothetical protein U5L04_05635 [Trueperaceae bacterium]|nr:hypothetical protein [Trueperaceae bacterium]
MNNLRIITPRYHSTFDYLIAALLCGGPWFFGYADVGTALWLSVISGVALIVYSTVTTYERAEKLLGIQTHLLIDIVLGALLLLSPWMFGYAAEVWLPLVLLGLALIAAALLTEPKIRMVTPKTARSAVREKTTKPESTPWGKVEGKKSQEQE